LLNSIDLAHFPKSEYWEFDQKMFKGKVKGVEGQDVGGLVLKKGAPASKAVEELFSDNAGSHLSTDCATRIAIILWKTRLDMFVPRGYKTSAFDSLYGRVGIELGGFRKAKALVSVKDLGHALLPGDIVLFRVPDAKEEGFANENTIYLGLNRYYAPGVGLFKSRKGLRNALKKLQKDGAIEAPYFDADQTSSPAIFAPFRVK
jgi:hypothetical protein